MSIVSSFWTSRNPAIYPEWFSTILKMNQCFMLYSGLIVPIRSSLDSALKGCLVILAIMQDFNLKESLLLLEIELSIIDDLILWIDAVKLSTNWGPIFCVLCDMSCDTQSWLNLKPHNRLGLSNSSIHSQPYSSESVTASSPQVPEEQTPSKIKHLSQV